MREIGPPGINVERITDLQRLGRCIGVHSEPGDIAVKKLRKIESKAPWYSNFQIAVAVGVASGAFAFLNGAAAAEMFAAAVGGGVGQLSRSWFSGRQINQYGVVALSAIVASGAYVLVAGLEGYADFRLPHYSAGFIASVLFLVPGFPLIAALFDLLQYQTVAAVSRLAYGMMLLLAIAFGLSIVIEVAGIDISRLPTLDLCQ